MSHIQWTHEQVRAIEHNSGNVLVSAAAGSGKTAVLTARILRLIGEGARMEQFLVVTFTQAAAREMKARIQSGLFEALSQEGAVRITAAKALSQIGAAQISTLHAFCKQVLERHFHEAQVDSAFGVLETAEADVMRLDVMEALFEARYEAKDAGFLALEELFGSEEALSKAVLQLLDAMRAQVDPEAFLSRAGAAYNDEAALEPIAQMMLAQARAQLQNAVDALQTARRRIITPNAAAVLDEELSIFRSLLDTAGRKGFSAFSDHIGQVKLLRWPQSADEAEKEWAQKSREIARDVLNSLKEAFARPLEQEAARMRAMAGHVDALCALTCEFEQAFAYAKQARNVIDYADMEHMALNVLRTDDVAEEYRERFKYIFVDEYQDSNAMQEALLDAIRRDDNLFLVGDVKQSIYRFRLADPTLFVDKAEAFQNTQGRHGGRRMDLPHNFRSAKHVVNAVNIVFSRLMSRELGDMEYDQSAALIATRTQDAQSVEWLICEDAQDGDADEASEGEAPSATEHEAGIAAQRIHELAATGVAYSDIAILLRATKRVAPVYARALARAGIPAVAEQSGAYFEAREVMGFLQLLRVVDNRRQDIPLLSVMRTFFDFSLDELVRLRNGGETLYDDVAALAEKLDSLEEGALRAAAQKCRTLVNTLAEWIFRSQLLRVDAFIRMLMDETGYAVCVGALPNGEGRKANLYALCERAQTYAQGQGRTLQGFLRFIERMQAAGADFGQAAANVTDAVRILSVHRSKGLEFPVVIFGALGRQFRRDAGTMAIHKTLGIGLPYVDFEQRTKGETLIRRAIRSVNYREGLSEELRILYVGMTRAKEQLILLGSVKGRLRDKIALLGISPAKSLMDWLFQALGGARAFELALEQGRGEADGLCVSLKQAPAAKAHSGTDWEAWARQSLEHADTRWVSEQLAWTYPHYAAANVPSKISASGLDKADELEKLPRFMQGAHGAQQGSLTHAALQWLSLDNVRHESDIRSQVEQMTLSGKLSRTQAEALDIRTLWRFFQSGLGKALCASPEVRREMHFQLAVPAARLFEGAKDTVLLQGVIDCCFLEDEEWILLDYKTDATHGNAEFAARAYAAQIAAYREALQTLTKRRVKASYIVFLRTGEAVAMDDTN